MFMKLKLLLFIYAVFYLCLVGNAQYTKLDPITTDPVKIDDGKTLVGTKTELSPISSISSVRLKETTLSSTYVSASNLNLASTSSLTSSDLKELYSIRSTNGSIDDFNPSISEIDDSEVNMVIAGPMDGDGVNLDGRIQNYCTETGAKLLKADVSAVKQYAAENRLSISSFTYQWYKCVAKEGGYVLSSEVDSKTTSIDETFDQKTAIKEIADYTYTSPSVLTLKDSRLGDFNRLKDLVIFLPYTWGDWEEIDGETAQTYEVPASQFEEESVLHVAYLCLISGEVQSRAQKGLVGRTGVTAYSKAEPPTFRDFEIEESYVCKNDVAQVQLDYTVTGDNTDIFWQYKKDGEWEKVISNDTIAAYPEYLEFDPQWYNLGLEDFRVKVTNSCVASESPSLRAQGVAFPISGNEKFEAVDAVQLVKEVCLNSTVNLTVTKNASTFVNAEYDQSWYVSVDGGVTWDEISGLSNNVYSGFSTLNLQVTPDSPKYNNYKYKCIIKGSCVTLESDVYTLNVKTPPEIPSLSISPYKLCPNDSVTVTAVDNSSEFTGAVGFRWYVDDQYMSGDGLTGNTVFKYKVGAKDLNVKCYVYEDNICPDISVSQSINVPVYQQPDVSIADPQSTACGGAEVTLTATAVNGKPVYNYTWSVPASSSGPTGTGDSGSTSSKTGLDGLKSSDLIFDSRIVGRRSLHIDNIRTNLAAEDRYYVTVTDACGNTDTASVYVKGPQPLALDAQKKDVLCNGQKNGELSVAIGGGTSDYLLYILFEQDGGNDTVFADTVSAGSYRLDALKAGTYIVKLTDACDSVRSQTVYIDEPEELTATISAYSNVSCFNGGNGSATVSISGGIEPYNINWSDGQKTPEAKGLFAGTHTVNVTDNNGCFASAQKILTEPKKFSARYVKTDANCFGLADGKIDAIATEGTKPYSFILKNAEGNDLPLTGSSQFDSLSAGVYDLVISDACGAIFEESVEVAQPDKLMLALNSKDISCFGKDDGSVQAVLSNAVGSVQYEWSNGSSRDIISGLDSGKYVVTVLDQCFTLTDSVVITQPEELAVSISSADVSCFGVPDGVASAIVDGGTYPYTYLWSNGIRTSSITDLFAGAYSVQVVDENGCAAQNSATINQDPLFAASVEVSPITCAGSDSGQIIVNTTAENGGISLEWSNSDWNGKDTITGVSPGVYSVTVSNSCNAEVVLSAEVVELYQPMSLTADKSDISCNGESDGFVALEAAGGTLNYTYDWSTGEKTRKIDSLIAGKYYYTVSDACGSIADSIEITEPEELQITVSGDGIECYGQSSGTASVIASGGTEPYLYLWNNGQRSSEIENLFAGEYSIQVADANGCAAFNSVNLEQNARFSASIEKKDVVCAGTNTGLLIVNTSLVAGTASYDWSNDQWDGMDTIEQVSAGSYSVTVSDACGAEVLLDETIAVVNEPMAVMSTKKDISCYGQSDGEIYLKVEEGVKPYTINWSNGMDGFDLSGLGADTIIYVLSDQCNQEITDTFIIAEPELFDVAVLATDASCYSFGDGTASVEITGGVKPYIYNWSIGVQSEELKALFPGKYSVNVFDANGCLASEAFEISQPEQIDVMASVAPTECGMQNGGISLSVTGGSQPYVYAWDNGETDPVLTDLAEGRYVLTVTDTNACQYSVTIPVGVSAPSLEICMLTVDKEIGKNKVVWEEYKESSITAVNIYRMIGGEYQWMGKVDSLALSFFDDELSNPKAVASRYAIKAEDACGNQSEFSPFHQTIHLGAAKGTDGVSSILDWTPYVDQSGGFQPVWYYLYRGSSEANLQLFDSVDAKVTTEYNDVDPQGAIYYRVGVKKEGGCDPKRLKTDSGPYSHSISNIAEVELEVTAVGGNAIISKVSPNPSNGMFVLNTSQYDGCVAIVSDIAGKAVWSGELVGAETSVDLHDQAMGIYTLQIKCGDSDKTVKLILEK